MMTKRPIQIALALVVSLLVVTIFMQGKNSATDTLEVSPQAKLPNQSNWDFNLQGAIEGELEKDSIAIHFGSLYEVESEDSINWLPKVAQKWDSLGHSLFAGYYFEKLAEKSNKSTDWYSAAVRYFNLVNRTNDTFARREIGNRAINSLQKTVELDPTNLKAKAELGVSYMEILPAGVSPMTGVGLLREVLELDSNNIDALYYLSYLSMKSGQYDKAVVRLEKLTKLEPEEPAYYEYLANAYLKAGDENSAERAIRKYAELEEDEGAKKSALDFIEKLNN
ncbi:MAG: tetratricopeptide repeat protein [Bacteroidia bacterium]